MITLNLIYTLQRKFIFSFFYIFIFMMNSATYLISHEFKPVYLHNDISKIQKEINDSHYAEEVLPYDLSGMLALLSYANEIDDATYVYLRSVLKMYTNLSKQAPFFDAEIFLEFLEHFTTIVSPIIKENAHISVNRSNKIIHTNILYEQLFSAFSVQYNIFKEDPDQFLKNISENIAKDALHNMEYIELQQGIVRFFENALSKLLWDPQNHENSWKITKEIASLFSSLVDKKIIPDINNFDDLLWSLSSRYTYFLRMFSDTLTPNFLHKMKREIENTSISLCLHDTNPMVSRKSHLINTINECMLMNQDTLLNQTS